MTFLVVGESIADLIGTPGSWRFRAVPGGSPLNVAVALAALGRPVRFASEVGDDLFGGLLRDHLARHGVGASELAAAPATSLAFARVGADGSASYDFRFDWRFPQTPRLAGVSCLHTGSLAALTGPGGPRVRSLMEAAASAGVTVSYDPNIRPSLLGERDAARAAVEECVRLARLVKVSAEDLAWLYPGEPDLAAARRWAAWPLHAGPAAAWSRGAGDAGDAGAGRLVVVTRGADGAVAVFGDRLVTCPAPAVEVADTVGAGDMFTAAYLAELDGVAVLTAEDVARALRHGCAAAAVVCTREGASPPTPGEVAALLPRVAATVA
ncbi:carbohydrate kinase [Microbispora corallina]|uniref:carbohydrate kinase family protein n=1 Tax=Microbispora corallina TaxID=83302 RepID=UPI0031D92540